MSENFIAYDDARHDLLTAAAYLGERIKSGDGHAEAMTAVVPRYLAENNVDLAAELANSVEDPFTRDKLLTEVAEKCAEIDDDDYAMQLAESIDDFGLKSQALERIALQKVHKGQIDKALEIAETLSHPDYIFAAAAVNAAVEGDRDNAVDLLAKVEYPSAKVSALQAMAASRLAGGNEEDAIALLAEAEQTATEIEHNEERIRTICDVGNHFVAAGRNDLAISAYDAAKREAEQLDNIHRDSFIAASVMGFLHAGSMDTADRTLDLITDKTQVANCLLAFSKFLWERGEKDDALDSLDEAYQILRSQRESETRDSRSRFALFASIAAQLAGFAKAERAIEIAQEINDDAQRTAALSQIANVLTIRREDEQARRALNAIADDANRTFALIGMSDAKAENGETTESIAYLDEAMHLAEEVAQLTARSSAYNEIIARYIDRGAEEKARHLILTNFETIRSVRDESSRAVALVNLAGLMTAAGLNIDIFDENELDDLLRKAV
jgi:tetratricopeptide (TPR) repeat protein